MKWGETSQNLKQPRFHPVPFSLQLVRSVPNPYQGVVEISNEPARSFRFVSQGIDQTVFQGSKSTGVDSGNTKIADV